MVRHPEIVPKRIFGESALLLGFLLLVPLLVTTSARRPWDFETYWYASSAALHGLDPYNQEQLSQLAGRPVQMPFVYPPTTTAFFAPFTLLSFWDGRWIWLALNLVALMALVHVWRRHLAESVPSTALCIATAFGFNASTIWALKTGNVAIVEQLLLWLGLTAIIADRRVRSAVCVVAASVFKLMPAAFLGLLILPMKGRRPRWMLLAISTLALLALIFL